MTGKMPKLNHGQKIPIYGIWNKFNVKDLQYFST